MEAILVEYTVLGVTIQRIIILCLNLYHLTVLSLIVLTVEDFLSQI